MAKSKEIYVENKVVKLATLKRRDDNPRTIRDKRFKELKKSLIDFPEMKQLREVVIDENNYILAGNQRIAALADLQYTDVEVKQVHNLPEAKKREFIAKDNDHYGEWDADAIANLWSVDELQNWGIDSIKFDGFGEDTPDTAPEDKKAKQVICPCGCEYVFNIRGNEFTD